MEVRTLGQFVEGEGILTSLRAMITDINARATKQAKLLGRQQKLPVVQCGSCDAKKACCHSVVVAPGHDGQSIGRALLAWAEDFAREHRCERLTLGVFPGNERARRTYEAAGFGVDMVRMAKPL